jgi:ribonuclease HI
MNGTGWRYPEGAPQFEKAGSFDAWIAGSGSPTKSAAAYRVEPSGKPEQYIEPDAMVSDGDSTDQRGVLGALAGVVEALPARSDVTVYSRSEYAVWLKREIAKWAAENWRDGKRERSNADILKRIWKVLNERELRFEVVHVPKGQPPHDEVIERLQVKARNARAGA